MDSLHNEIEYADQHEQVALHFNLVYEIDSALNHSLRAKNIKEKMVSPLDIRMASVYSNLGSFLLEFALYDSALQLFLRFTKIHATRHHPDQLALASNFNDIGSAFERMEQFDSALFYYQKSSNTEGVENKTLASSFDNMARIHYYNGAVDTASDYFQKSLKVMSRIFPQGHPFVAITLSNLGICYSDKGVWDSAEYYQFKALKIREKNFQ